MTTPPGSAPSILISTSVRSTANSGAQSLRHHAYPTLSIALDFIHLAKTEYGRACAGTISRVVLVIGSSAFRESSVPGSHILLLTRPRRSGDYRRSPVLEEVERSLIAIHARLQ